MDLTHSEKAIILDRYAHCYGSAYTGNVEKDFHTLVNHALDIHGGTKELAIIRLMVNLTPKV